MTIAPTSLLKLQSWFGKTITQSCDEAFSPLQEKVTKYILPSLTLTSKERLEIYHQQYWWRLLKVLQENFPFLCRLFGYRDFNEQIAIPFLLKFSPSSWDLSLLGKNLPEWIEDAYNKEDKNLVLTSAQLDWSVKKSFYMRREKPVDFASLSTQERLTKKITLQPYVFLFQFHADFFSLRDALLKEGVDFWNTHPFPELRREVGYFVLYRSHKNQVKWQQVPSAAFTLLSSFKGGASIMEGLESLVDNLIEEAQDNISLWFHEWTYLNWFCEV